MNSEDAIERMLSNDQYDVLYCMDCGTWVEGPLPTATYEVFKNSHGCKETR